MSHFWQLTKTVAEFRTKRIQFGFIAQIRNAAIQAQTQILIRNVFSWDSDRERQIREHLARGESNKTIARALDISHDTVKLHVRHILAKLNLSSRVEAAVLAVEARAAAPR